jgi:hypothetical protein
LINICKRIITFLVLGVAGTGLALTIAGCQYFPESTFALANDSRLPKWFALSPGLARGDLSVTMSYHVKPWGRSATFVLRGKTKTLEKVNGRLVCKEPLVLKNRPQRECVWLSSIRTDHCRWDYRDDRA